jgi:hypothetical protein
MIPLFANDDPFATPPSPRPIWLMTFADLALLLVGFLILVQTLDRDKLAAAMRAGFGDPGLPVAAAGLAGFAPGSAALPRSPRDVADWALDAVRDPRVALTLTGEATGEATGERGDADPATGSPAILAADRARNVATALIAAGVPADRLSLATRRGPARSVTVTLAFSPAE